MSKLEYEMTIESRGDVPVKSHPHKNKTAVHANTLLSVITLVKEATEAPRGQCAVRGARPKHAAMHE